MPGKHRILNKFESSEQKKKWQFMTAIKKVN